MHYAKKVLKIPKMLKISKIAKNFKNFKKTLKMPEITVNLKKKFKKI